MATSNDHNRHDARHLEFEPNRQGRSSQGNDDNSSASSSSSYYGSKHGVQATGQSSSQREQSSGSNWISRGNNRTWVGASLGVLAAGAFVALTRDKWSSWGSSLSSLADKSGLTGSRSDQGQQDGEQSGNNQRRGSQPSSASAKSSGSQKSASGQKGSQADASLNREAASGIKSSPSSSKSFTDEGATGNND
ncbi:hypothetical protein [Hymenobacter latericus]|uniref:hypothetical protein n=1 Tax=Hymenobacter sp. YIM 151858-1 TaxID=2987688 RepID=UPI00222795B4|nr:hypothetical protein [Hymenobacter sp. YIM 151858-1]UYZ59499.1 hypothetical protein OIS50_01565 [Hymenobacter sp. YIM 151858-1]